MRHKTGDCREQLMLFGECVDDRIAQDNMVRVIDEFVELLDLKEMEFNLAECARTGRPPYNPGDLLKLYIYSYFNRIRSSRNIEKETGRNLEVIWLMKGLRPDHLTISNFRKVHRKSLKKVFHEFNTFLKSVGEIGTTCVTIDGTKMRAVNSTKNNVTISKLEASIKRYDAEISRYMEMLDQNDKNEAKQKDLSPETVRTKLAELKKKKRNKE